MIHYILQTVLFQLFFLIIYDAFLKRETFFNWNRVYLLSTSILSFVLPIIKIEQLKNVIHQEYIIRLPEVIIGNINNTQTIQNSTEVLVNTKTSIFTWENIFYFGVFMALVLFLLKVSKIFMLIYKNPKETYGKLKLVKLLKSNSAFSFFNFVFIGEQLKPNQVETILKHEVVHIKQNHTLDLLFFEILRIACWFNPLVYVYQNKMTVLHEFIADAEAIKQQGKSSYYQSLLSQVFDTNKISFINPFFKQSLIKKRIVMLQKSKSKQINLLKYALLLPIVFGMLVYSSSEGQVIDSLDNSKNKELTDEELITKLEEEYNKLKESGADFQTIHKTFFIKSNKYILSKEEYYRQNIYFKSILRDAEKDYVESTLLNRSYKDYLSWIRTDKAKEVWENNTYDGILRLVVDDMKNLTEVEQKRKKEKIDLIKKDYYFHSLLMTDGKITITLQIDKPSVKEDKTSLFETETIDVPFAVIDQVPVYPSCETLETNDDKRDCMARNISEHVNKNFNTKLANDLKLTGRQRINVIFKIDTEGNVVNIHSRASHPGLEEEAIRVIKALPKMIPGEHKGQKVNVPYSLPIIFQVNKNKE